jgi:predicted phosphodiesterase
LIKDIEGRTAIDSALDKIDFIVFSGDVASKGQAHEYEAAKREFFEPLLEATYVSPRLLFIVPGNHDLDETLLEQLPDELKRDSIAEEEVKIWLEDNQKREQLLSPFAAFKNFVTTYTGQDSPEYSNVRIWKFGSKKVSLLGINSAWMCRRHKNSIGEFDDWGFALVGEPQIHKPLDKISEVDIKIAVLHHSKDWLVPFDGNRVWSRLVCECDFILHGHGHNPEVIEMHSTTGDCVVIPVGASYERRMARDPKHSNSYNFVNLDFKAGKGMVFLRRWIDSRTEWVKDDETYEGGRFDFDLPNRMADSRHSLADSPNEASRTVFDQRGQTVYGPQTNIAGNVEGPKLSDTFSRSMNMGNTRKGGYP